MQGSCKCQAFLTVTEIGPYKVCNLKPNHKQTLIARETFDRFADAARCFDSNLEVFLKVS